ncbi:MAG TPA: hypothetical protein VGJ80_06260 [Gemmatimonadales bacterium]|jgi:hypothetical protein
MPRGYDDWKTTDPRDREPDGPGLSYVCTACDWHGKQPLQHARETGHAIRIKNSPPSWPNIDLLGAKR